MGEYYYVVSRNLVEVGGQDLYGCASRPVAGLCEHGYETGFYRCPKLFDLFSNCQLFNEDCIRWVEDVEGDRQQLTVMRFGQKGNDREELASVINGAMFSEDSRIMECVVSCVTFV